MPLCELNVPVLTVQEHATGIAAVISLQVSGWVSVEVPFFTARLLNYCCLAQSPRE